jgi:hypothetical protein
LADLPREVVLQIARLGWTTPASLAGVGPEDFHNILPETIAAEIIARAQRWTARREKTIENIRRPGSGVPAAAGIEKPDTSPKKQNDKESIMPQAIMLDGRRVGRGSRSNWAESCTLRAKSFKYLFTLRPRGICAMTAGLTNAMSKAAPDQVFHQLRQS